jgi:cob(I)alamin adenosyltransferase
MNRIYTRKGDDGETALFRGGRISKADPRVEAYGTVDELSAAIGCALAAGVEARTAGLLQDVQADLLAIGAHLATMEPRGRTSNLPPLPVDRVGTLEARIDDAESALPPLKHFILPGGSPAGAALHLARTVCRRAERRVVSLSRSETVEAGIVAYLNRLGDLLFVLARLHNHHAGSPEPSWKPEDGRNA